MRPSPRSLPFTLLLGGLAALPPLSVDISLPTLPEVGVAFAAGSGDVQATLSAFLVGFAAGQLVHGPASDRLGRRPVLLAGLALYVVAGLACAIAPSLAILVVARLIQGVGACAGIVVARAIVRDAFAADETAAKQSVLSSISTLAMLSAPILGGLVLSIAGFRAVYAVLPAAGLLLLAACAVGLVETRAATAGRPAGTGYGRVLAEPRALAAAAVNALIFGGMFAYISGSPHLLLDTFGVSPRGFGALFAVTALASLAGSSTNRVLLRRLPAPTLTTVGFGLIVVAIAALGLTAAVAPRLELVIVAMAIYTFACGIVMPNSVAAAMAPLPEVAGATAAVVGCAQFVVGAAAAAAVGVVLPGTVGGIAITVAAFALPGLAVAAVTAERKARAAPDATTDRFPGTASEAS